MAASICNSCRGCVLERDNFSVNATNTNVTLLLCTFWKPNPIPAIKCRSITAETSGQNPVGGDAVKSPELDQLYGPSAAMRRKPRAEALARRSPGRGVGNGKFAMVFVWQVRTPTNSNGGLARAAMASAPSASARTIAALMASRTVSHSGSLSCDSRIRMCVCVRVVASE